MANRQDPLNVFQWGLTISAPSSIQIGDPKTAFFKSCNGLKAEVETSEYHEGGNNDGMIKMLGMVKYPNLVLKNGFTGDSKFFDFLQSLTFGNKGDPGYQRIEGAIVQFTGRQKSGTWYFTQGAIVKWEGAELDASKNELFIETIEIAHHGLWYEGEMMPL